MSHFPATRFLLQPRLTLTSHPSYLFLPSEPCMCLFWGSFASASPPNSFSGVLWLFFLNPNPCTCLGKCSSTFLVVPRHDLRSSPFFGGAMPQSEAVLGLSSIQTYFILQISGWLLKLPFFPLSYLDLLLLLRRNWLAVKIIFPGLLLLNFGLWVKDMSITWLPKRQISLRLTTYSGGR